MNGQPNCYVTGSLAAMLRVSRLGGIAPLNFVKKGSGWRISPSTGWNCYGYFIVTVIIVTTVGSLIVDFGLENEQSVRMTTNTRRVVWIIDVACMLMIAGASVYGAAAQMRTMISSLNRIEKINLELNNRHWPVHNERKKTRFFFIWVTATVVLIVVDYLAPIRDHKRNQEQIWIKAMYSFYYCCYWILQLRELNFIMITLHVMYCLRSVNESLKNLLREFAKPNELPLMTLFNRNLSKGPKEKLFKIKVNTIADCRRPRPEGSPKSMRHHETVRRLALAYANTCDVVRDVDSANGMIVLMLLGSFLFHLVCTPYYVVTSLLKENNYLQRDPTMNAVYIGVQLVWCFYHTVNLLMLIEPCHLTQMEMEATCELVSHLMRCTDSIHDPLAVELETFFKHLFLNQASYSAMHVTTISRSLVATILGSITTYLVIIIQL